MVTQTVNLDLVPSQFGRSNVTVPCSQYDKEFRVIQFVIYNKKALFNIPSGSVVTIRGTKPQDNTGFEYECNFSGNLVTFPLKEQITVYHGLIPAELRITKNGEIIGSANFVFMVEESPLKDNTVISDTDLPLLQEALNAVDETLSYRNEAETFSLNSEAWAVGQRNGEDVESDDPTYENNSKYYSQLAQTAEQNASTSATNAENYKNLASQYADNASASALSASNSATSASESATNASNSAQSASDSADRAEQTAQDVEGYVDDAEGYALEAKGYRDTASQYATNAQTYASNASTSATSASSSASNAQTYMNNAQASATNASQSATSAQAFASNASTSATNANASATSASQSATGASDSATSASESASNASTSETNAQTSAESASASATSAETSAEQAEAVLEEVIGIKDNFAEKDGFYPDMSVGHLLSDTTVDDEFTYQVTNYDGKAKINSIKGNTLKWNQLYLNPTVFTTASTYPFANGQTFYENHKYLCDFKGTLIDPDGYTPQVYLYGRANGEATLSPLVCNGFVAYIYNCSATVTSNGTTSSTADDNAWIFINRRNNANISSLNVIDLTAMFGSTKADEIYAMEQAQAGSGVAYFRSLYPLPYYQYDAGSLQSFNGSGIKTVGKNHFNKDTLIYGKWLDTDTGAIANASSAYAVTEYIPVVGGVTYTMSDTASSRNWLYDENKNPLTRITTYSFTPSVSGYVVLTTHTASADVNTIQLVVGTSVGDYEPYTSSIKPLPIGHINIWDEEWEIGGINNTTGETQTDSSRIRSKNFCRCLPSTTYYTTVGLNIYQYDADKNFISMAWVAIGTFTTNANAHYFKISGNTAYGITYKYDICINVSDSAINGTYVPYMESYFPNGMRRANNAYDEQTSSKASTRVMEVDLGALTWNAPISANPNIFFCNSSTEWRDLIGERDNAICSKYERYDGNITSNDLNNTMLDKQFVINKGNRGSTGNFAVGSLLIKDSSYSTAQEFKTAMSGVKMMVEMATPTEVNVDLDLSYDIEKGGTEQLLPINTDVPTTSPLSRNVTFYYENEDANNLAKILAMIAPVENKTVSKAYTVGQYLIYDYVLYKVTSNIANGGTITVGTNVTATSIASILESM